MVCAGVLRGLILFCLFFSGVWGVEKTLDQNTLAPAIKFLRQNYQPGQNQYAIAFNAPVDKCADYLDNNFLNRYPGRTVKNALNSAGRLYKGQKLIAARPKPIPDTKVNQHSEYLLMNVPSVDTSPMKELLGNDNTGCVVFYTYNSPCTSTCTKPGGCYSIIQALDMFKDHKGPKAFVFTQVWKYDCDKDISTNLKEVLERVPLYRCKDNNNCVACTANNLKDCM
ncbi:uncharacterized protein LOC121684250 [Alosa sapidissima]|uniref:uncharacterized protein LOC121684250 n=1 Tax=Alosa sapidissima TaxID=34773 RepID=UPI001C086AEB|nr:uncharacterized protein LOC121684250 [Alosa sapidissima]